MTGWSSSALVQSRVFVSVLIGPLWNLRQGSYQTGALHRVGSTQSDVPSGWNSRFQIGTVVLMRSIAARQAANASARCGETATMATETSPIERHPTRCAIETRVCGNSTRSHSETRFISDSAIGA